MKINRIFLCFGQSKQQCVTLGSEKLMRSFHYALKYYRQTGALNPYGIQHEDKWLNRLTLKLDGLGSVLLPPAVAWGTLLQPSLLQAAVLQLSLTSDLPEKGEKRKEESLPSWLSRSNKQPQATDSLQKWAPSGYLLLNERERMWCLFTVTALQLRCFCFEFLLLALPLLLRLCLMYKNNSFSGWFWVGKLAPDKSCWISFCSLYLPPHRQPAFVWKLVCLENQVVSLLQGSTWHEQMF